MGSFTNRLKKTTKSSIGKIGDGASDGLAGVADISDDIDLDAGTITVDTSAPETTVSTSEILQE